MKQLMEDWRRYTEEESSYEEIEEGALKNLALGAAMAGQLATANPALAADAPQSTPAATQQVQQDQEQIAIGEKAQLMTVYNGVSRVKNPYLKQQIEDAARSGKVNTFKELTNYIKASGGLNAKDMEAFKEAFKKAGDHFHKNPETRAAKWDSLSNLKERKLSPEEEQQGKLQ